MSDWRDETQLCNKCGRRYKIHKYDPHYDQYGLMGNGYSVSHFTCWDCLEGRA